jgi:hypothetical protein
MNPKTERLLLQIEESNAYHGTSPDGLHVIVNPKNDQGEVLEELTSFFQDFDFQLSEAELFEWAGGVEGIFTCDILMLLYYPGSSFMIYSNLDPHLYPVQDYPSTIQ